MELPRIYGICTETGMLKQFHTKEGVQCIYMYEIFKEHILYDHAHVAASIALTKNMIYLENLVTCFCV